MRIILAGLLILTFSCCSSPKTAPYSCGPVLKQKVIKKTFQPIINFMDLRKGDVFADIGASSGYYTVMMATLLEGNTIFIQDIDTTCLNKREFDKVTDYYSRQSNKSLRGIHTFHLTVGSASQTNLPENTFDKIYTNGTFHHLTNPDEILQDIYKALKADGTVFIRDSFSNKTKTEYCQDKKNPATLLRSGDFLEIMARNNFKLQKSKSFGKYPVFMFTKQSN